jgi:plasmid stability protein
MAQFIVRDLEEAVKTQLKRQAACHGRSMEDEVRHILRDAVKEQNQDHQARLTDCGAFCESGSDCGATRIARSGSPIGEIR